MDIQDRLKQSPEYQKVLKQFSELRDAKSVYTNRKIEEATGSAGGSIKALLESKTSPTLFKFVTWCRYAGIEVTLRRTITRRPRKKDGPPEPNEADIIDDIRHQLES